MYRTHSNKNSKYSKTTQSKQSKPLHERTMWGLPNLPKKAKLYVDIQTPTRKKK